MRLTMSGKRSPSARLVGDSRLPNRKAVVVACSPVPSRSLVFSERNASATRHAVQANRRSPLSRAEACLTSYLLLVMAYSRLLAGHPDTRRCEGLVSLVSSCFDVGQIILMYGFEYHFNNLCFNNSQAHDESM